MISQEEARRLDITSLVPNSSSRFSGEGTGIAAQF